MPEWQRGDFLLVLLGPQAADGHNDATEKGPPLTSRSRVAEVSPTRPRRRGRLRLPLRDLVRAPAGGPVAGPTCDEEGEATGG